MSNHSKAIFICIFLLASIFVPVTGAFSATNHLAPSAVAADGAVPLSCEPVLYQVISGQLKKLDFMTGLYSDVGDYSGFNRINAMGYNKDDNFLYALPRDNGFDVNGHPVSRLDIIKIDANGDVYYHLTPNAPIINSVVADVVDNVLWILKSKDIYRINLLNGNVEHQRTDISVPIVDWGYIDGKFYGARQDVMYIVDPSTTVATVSSIKVPDLNGTAYGAAYVFDNDDLYVSSNKGGLFQIIGYDTSSPQAFYVSNSEITSQNDGASCPVATLELPPECGDVDVDTDGDDLLDSIDIDNDNDGILDQVELSLSVSGDTDGDGIRDLCDLDSDNDGISDLVESGAAAATIAADSDRSGNLSRTESAIVNGGTADKDFDGLMDSFDSDKNDVNPGNSAGTTPVNSDGAGEPDYLDLDSDNDGIPDAVEAQPTNGYAGVFPTDNNVTDDDSDGDGVIDIYENNVFFGGGFNTPQNTDGVDEPDYLDQDSDNDTKPDSDEHGMSPENGGPANPTYADPNGRVDDPQSTLLNESGDDSEVGYRELWLPPTIDPDDKDGDGVPNSIDIDDDNDGIVDQEENRDLDVSSLVRDQSGRSQGMGSEGHLLTGATNNCPSGQVAVALYGGSVTRGMVGANSVDSLNNGICVQLIPTADWVSMSIADFQTFDVLWIGNDDCTGVGGAAAFDQAVASRPVWEAAIDPGNLMIAGGDYDYHVYRGGGGDARAITAAMINESADGSEPGLVLQAGCYSVYGSPWYQNLGGTFEGLFHGGVGNANPGPTDVTSHEFNTKYGWDSASYQFYQSCHGGMYIAPGSPVEQYNLQVLFYYPGGVVPCFMMSDERFPPFFPTRDSDNDLVPDACDLDSDNDGISDLIESGATPEQIAMDINNDGSISPLEVTIATGGTADADGDGLMDIFDSDINDTSHLTSIGTIPTNSDSDIRHDFIDLDSDDDGIPDVIEGKPTQDFDQLYGNDGDVRNDDNDTDGVIAVFDSNDLIGFNFGGSFVLPEDTDDDGVPDYLDLDSDNDFALDEWESGLILNGNDLGDFADGIDDLVNPSEFYRDNNGIVDLPWRDLDDEDDNAETDGDVDYREFNPNFDRGDTPSVYGEATHAISEFVDIWMGYPDQRPDEDEDPFVPGDDALADDLTNTGSVDDEDAVTWYGEASDYDTGIVFYPQSPDGHGNNTGIYNFDVEVYNETFDFGFLDVWIDYDGNQQFDYYELEESRVVPRSTGSQTLSGLDLVVPQDAACGRSYARFRFSDESFGAPTEYGGWGEVEDHAITIDCRTDLEVYMEFEPDADAVEAITFDEDTRTYNGGWELSHEIAVRTFIKNNGPQSARSMVVTVQLPTDMGDVVQVPSGRWACDIDDDNLAICTAYGLANGASEQVIDFTGRIPGSFELNSVVGYAEVDHESGDLNPSNNRVDYDIKVTKVWEGEETMAPPFVYARFSDVLSLGNPQTIDRDIEIGDRLATPIQVPIFYGAGAEMLSQPILRTRWCNRPEHQSPLYEGCDEESDLIMGTIAVESHTTISVTQMTRQAGGTFIVDPTSPNLVTEVITTTVAQDNDGNPMMRYAEPDFANCTIWMGREAGGCVSKQATIELSGMTNAQEAFYEWDQVNLTPVVFQTAGGRDISCDNGEGKCVYIENSSPGVYMLEGLVTYHVVFYDEGGARLGTELYKERRSSALSFFVQIVAPFVEPDQ